jgi:hypothetical protein
MGCLLLVVVVAMIWKISAEQGKPKLYRVELIPTILPAIYFFVLQLLWMWNKWRLTRPAVIRAARANPRKPDAFVRSVALPTGIFVFVVMVITVHLSFSSLWQTTRRVAFLAEIGPWGVNCFLLLVLLMLWQPWLVRRQWAADPAWQRPKVVELDADGFHVADSVRRVHFAWQHFVEAYETDNLLVLLAENGLGYSVPKRAFGDADEIDRARALIQNNISYCRFLVIPGGFAVVPKPVVPVSGEEKLG